MCTETNKSWLLLWSKQSRCSVPLTKVLPPTWPLPHSWTSCRSLCCSASAWMSSQWSVLAQGPPSWRCSPCGMSLAWSACRAHMGGNTRDTRLRVWHRNQSCNQWNTNLTRIIIQLSKFYLIMQLTILKYDPCSQIFNNLTQILITTIIHHAVN